MLVGLMLFAIGAWRAGTGAQRTLRNAMWMAPWFAGQVIIGALGRYGNGSRSLLPNWIDVLVVIAFSLVIFYWGVSLALNEQEAAAAVAKDAHQIDYEARSTPRG